MRSEICKKCADKSCYGYDREITECVDFQPMTNYDLLISKTPEELAALIGETIACSVCITNHSENDECPCHPHQECHDFWLDLLKAPADKEGEG